MEIIRLDDEGFLVETETKGELKDRLIGNIGIDIKLNAE